MSYDRVLPIPVAVRYDFFRSDPSEHRILKNPPISYGALENSITNAPVALREQRPSYLGSCMPVSFTNGASASQWCLCRRKPKIPRPRNSFILYRQHRCAALVAQRPDLKFDEISKYLGTEWRKKSEREKDEWRALAQEEKIRHASQYPTYRYQPKRIGRDGDIRHSGQGISNSTPGGSTCDHCGGKIINALTSSLTPFIPNGGLSASTSATQGQREDHGAANRNSNHRART